MNINRLQPQDIYKSFAKTSIRSDDSTMADKKAIAQVSADRVEISPESADLNEARKLVQQSGITDTSDLQASSRNDKIEALKQQVESGKYNVSSKDVANSILTGKFFDERA